MRGSSGKRRCKQSMRWRCFQANMCNCDRLSFKPAVPCAICFLPQRYFINNPEAAAAAADQLAPSNIGKQIGGKQAATE
jgi:hypothetical protein